MKKVQMNLSVPDYVRDHIYGKAEADDRHPAYILTKIIDRAIADEFIELPEFLIEMSKQMNEQPNRCTAHPFWQVRTKRTYPAPSTHSDLYEVYGDDGVIYRSFEPMEQMREHLYEEHKNFCVEWAKENHPDEDSLFEAFEHYDACGELPEGLEKVYVQEIEEVVTTHLTEAGAMAFIKRKQHDYPKLYTYVESAYWSPQLRQLQDWIIGLTNISEG